MKNLIVWTLAISDKSSPSLREFGRYVYIEKAGIELK